MFIFTQTINSYDNDRGFSVTYRPEDERLTPISLWVKLPPLTDPNEILQYLSSISPQAEWQRQIDSLSVDTALYESLVGTEVRVDDAFATVPAAPDSNPFNSETIQQIKSRII